MKLQDQLDKYTIEKIRNIPKKICEILIIDIDEYHNLQNTDKKKKDELDQELINFKKTQDYLGFYNKDNFRIYVKSTWLSKTVCERRILDFLKGN